MVLTLIKYSIKNPKLIARFKNDKNIIVKNLDLYKLNNSSETGRMLIKLTDAMDAPK
jgi:hypothetical protein